MRTKTGTEQKFSGIALLITNNKNGENFIQENCRISIPDHVIKLVWSDPYSKLIWKEANQERNKIRSAMYANSSWNSD